MAKDIEYWFIERNRATGETKFGVGRYGPRLLIQGEEKDVDNLVACLNGNQEKCEYFQE